MIPVIAATDLCRYGLCCSDATKFDVERADGASRRRRDNSVKWHRSSVDSGGQTLQGIFQRQGAERISR